MPKEEKSQSYLIEPLIDSRNPPISVDSLLLGESGKRYRLSCFAGTPFPEKVETFDIQSENGPLKLTKTWFRPVCVMDVDGGALHVLLIPLINRLAEHPEEQETFLRQFPELKEKLRAALPILEKLLS